MILTVIMNRSIQMLKVNTAALMMKTTFLSCICLGPNDGSNVSAVVDDKDDDVPLAQLTNTDRVKKTLDVGKTFRWQKISQLQHNTEWKGSFSHPPDIKEPIEYFRQFFGTQLLQHVAQTNVYVVQSGSTFRIDVAEIEQYLGILVKMGLVHMPRYKCYWSAELQFPAVADIMSHNRFSDLTKYIHFNDNDMATTNREDTQYDRYFKVRQLLNMLREACLEIEPEEKNEHRRTDHPSPSRAEIHSDSTFRKKTNQWGFKVLAHCGVSGIAYDFCMYDGKSPDVQESCGYQSGDFVIKLCQTMAKGQNYKLYFDNWFTFFELQIQLHSWDIWSIGTVRSNRLRGCTLKSEKELQKIGRGATDMAVDANSGLTVVRWLNNSTVQLSLTHSGIQPMSSVKRWDRKQHRYVDVDCPAIMKEYNEYMGGVDLFDMLMSLYKVDHKSTKWYRLID